METGYTADLITKHAIDFIDRNKNRSFFLYLPHLAIHFPWQGPEDEGYRVKGKDYSDLSKLGRLESKDVSGKVKRMVESIDRSVGQIVSALENQNLTGKTLLFFTSDNGGYLNYTGGYHNISNNGPLRGQKGDVYEGGHRVPAIAWWPGQIEPGICNQTLMTFDLFPTFAELAGIVNPEKEYALDGISLKQLLLEQSSIETRSLFWRIRDQKAVRYKNWKLVQPGQQLYRLDNDLGEADNLANQRPEVVQLLLEKLTGWESLVEPGKHQGDSQ
jgi:arylsulfatase A-like enzyme